MMRQPRGTDAVPRLVRPTTRNSLYQKTLEKAHAVADRSLDRLRALQQQFPSDLPEDLIHALQQAHGDEPGLAAAHPERRWALRFPKSHGRVYLHSPRMNLVTEGRLIDWSWTGLRVHLPGPLREGSVFTVRSADPQATPPARVEVRYCFPADGGWIAGCESLRSA